MSPFWILLDDGSGGDNWSYNTCKAPVTFYRPDVLPVTQPSVSKHCSTIMDSQHGTSQRINKRTSNGKTVEHN